MSENCDVIRVAERYYMTYKRVTSVQRVISVMEENRRQTSTIQNWVAACDVAYIAM